MHSKSTALLVCLACAFTLPGLRGDVPEARLKTVAVAAFKNGLSFFVRQGEVTLAAGEGRIEPIPSATLGSLWIAPNDAGVSLDELVAYAYRETHEQSLKSLAEILRANIGKTVTVVPNAQKEITGEVVGLRAKDQPGMQLEAPQPAASLAEEAAPVYSRAAAPEIVPEILLLKVEGKLVALPVATLSQAILPPDAIWADREVVEKRALRFRVKGAISHANLTMGYLQNGLGWTPSYLISLEDDKSAQITMQAVLANDAEDLSDANVFFVVGMPNFAYSNLLSPMAMQQTLLQFMNAVTSRDRSARNLPYANAITSQAMVNATDDLEAPGDTLPSFTTAIGELAGAPEEDLFLYTRSGVTLARGERATYNVFAGNVGFEHIYEWEVPDTSGVDAYGRNSNDTNEGGQNAANSVWHSIRLKNSTKFPWTSAPAMVLSGTKPVAQDTLAYTPKGAVTKLKLTAAVDIRAGHEEHEINRQENAPHRSNRRYDLLTIEGKLKVKNYKAQGISLQVRKSLRGTVVTASDDAKTERLAEGIQADNPNSRLTWNLTVKAGEEKVLTYQYQVWLAR